MHLLKTRVKSYEKIWTLLNHSWLPPLAALRCWRSAGLFAPGQTLDQIHTFTFQNHYCPAAVQPVYIKGDRRQLTPKPLRLHHLWLLANACSLKIWTISSIFMTLTTKTIFRNAADNYPKEKGSWCEVTCTSVNLAWNPVDHTQAFDSNLHKREV